MRSLGIVFIVISVVVLTGDLISGIYGSYQYEKNYSSYWNLAEKASTIPQKADYVDKFVLALENSNMRGMYNALFMNTPDNGFDNNLEALKSLQKRLHEIKTMDVTSFQYQTAIQQITAQEQGEAKAMLSVFEGIWWKKNHLFLWNWVCAINLIFMIILGAVGGMILASEAGY